MDKFTPGPWVVKERERLEDGSEYPMHVVGGSRELSICDMEFCCTDQPYSDSMAESSTDVRSKRANARLIAAAPDLYCACNEALNALIACAVPAGGCDDREAREGLTLPSRALQAEAKRSEDAREAVMSIARRLGKFTASDIARYLPSAWWPLGRVTAVLGDLEQRGEIEACESRFRLAE